MSTWLTFGQLRRFARYLREGRVIDVSPDDECVVDAGATFTLFAGSTNRTYGADVSPREDDVKSEDSMGTVGEEEESVEGVAGEIEEDSSDSEGGVRAILHAGILGGSGGW
jgi:hypothetical protein